MISRECKTAFLQKKKTFFCHKVWTANLSDPKKKQWMYIFFKFTCILGGLFAEKMNKILLLFAWNKKEL